MTLLELLENIDYYNNTYEDVSKLLCSIGEIPATKVVLMPNTIFSRFRMGSGYSSVSSLTYRNAKYCTSMQRATLPNETAFYCCVSADKGHLENTRYIGLFECSKLAKDLDAKGREFITESRWINKEPLNALSFVTDKTFLDVKNNNLLNALRKQYAQNKKNLTDGQIRLSELINHEFTKTVDDNRKYLISASIAHDIFYKIESSNGVGFDAIIYPSVPVKGEGGLNVIIRPDVVDRCLLFTLRVELSHLKNKEESLLNIDKIYSHNGKLLEKRKDNEYVLCSQLNISSIKELPIVRH